MTTDLLTHTYVRTQAFAQRLGDLYDLLCAKGIPDENDEVLTQYARAVAYWELLEGLCPRVKDAPPDRTQGLLAELIGGYLDTSTPWLQELEAVLADDVFDDAAIFLGSHAEAGLGEDETHSRAHAA